LGGRAWGWTEARNQFLLHEIVEIGPVPQIRALAYISGRMFVVPKFGQFSQLGFRRNLYIIAFGENFPQNYNRTLCRDLHALYPPFLFLCISRIVGHRWPAG
jgi:hypothetical protein